MKSQSRIIAISLLTLSLCAHTALADLEAGFNSPPSSSKPRTWMHAMSGNMSKVGMTKDFDISNLLVKGTNEIEIRVTNQWTNRLIGDERYPNQDDGYALSSYNPAEDSSMPKWFLNNQPMPRGPRTTFCSGQFYKKNAPLLPSGLKGPVTIRFEKMIQLTH